MSDFQCLVGFFLFIWVVGVLMIIGSEGRDKKDKDEQK
jgi:hypothetical protein